MNENPRKIDGKIDRKGDASWNRFLEGFLLILIPNSKKWYVHEPKVNRCKRPRVNGSSTLNSIYA